MWILEDLEGILEGLEGILGVLGRSWRDLGGSWGNLGDVAGILGGPLGTLGGSWQDLGGILGDVGGFWSGLVGSCFGGGPRLPIISFKVNLGGSLAGGSWWILERSWGILRGLGRGGLGGILRGFGGILEGSGSWGDFAGILGGSWVSYPADNEF